MLYLYIIIGLVIIIAGIYVEARNGNYDDEEDGEDDVDDKLPYRKKYYLFSEAEKKFYDVLKTALKDEYLIFAKVRVADLLYSSKSKRSWQTDFNRIKAKHIDFVICDKEKISPLVAIELDDSSHNRYDRKQRDNFIDEAFKVAQLPLLHIKNSYQYDQQSLLNQIQTCLNKNRL